MASNKTWACFPCHRTARSEFKAPTCPSCGKLMRDCGKRFPTPKNTGKGWKKAEAELNRITAYNRLWTDPEEQRKVRADRIGRR